jgi:hypothetical protein
VDDWNFGELLLEALEQARDHHRRRIAMRTHDRLGHRPEDTETVWAEKPSHGVQASLIRRNYGIRTRGDLPSVQLYTADLVIEILGYNDQGKPNGVVQMIQLQWDTEVKPLLRALARAGQIAEEVQVR